MPVVARNPLRVASAPDSNGGAFEVAGLRSASGGTASGSSTPVAAGAATPPPKMGLEHINMAAHDAARAKRRRELMLDDEPLHLTAWEPRRRVWWRVALLQAWYVLSVGFVAVAASWPWLQRWFARFVSEPCSERDADFVIAENVDGSFEVCSVEAVAERPRELLAGAARRTSARVQPRDIPPPRRMVVYRHTRYVFDAVSQAYVQLDPEAVTGAPIGGVGVGAVVGGSDAMVGDGGGAPGAVGLTAAQAAARVARFGRNVIDVPMPPTSVLLITEILHPFIFFQVWVSSTAVVC